MKKTIIALLFSASFLSAFAQIDFVEDKKPQRNTAVTQVKVQGYDSLSVIKINADALAYKDGTPNNSADLKKYIGQSIYLPFKSSANPVLYCFKPTEILLYRTSCRDKLYAANNGQIGYYQTQRKVIDIFPAAQIISNVYKPSLESCAKENEEDSVYAQYYEIIDVLDMSKSTFEKQKKIQESLSENKKDNDSTSYIRIKDLSKKIIVELRSTKTNDTVYTQGIGGNFISVAYFTKMKQMHEGKTFALAVLVDTLRPLTQFTCISVKLDKDKIIAVLQNAHGTQLQEVVDYAGFSPFYLPKKYAALIQLDKQRLCTAFGSDGLPRFMNMELVSALDDLVAKKEAERIAAEELNKKKK